MSNQPILSPVDRAVLDTLTAVAIAQCRAAGVTNDALLASATTAIVVDDLVAQARTGDSRARRLLRHLLVCSIAGWMEDEEAAGRPVYSTTDALKRIIENASRQPRQQA
jgi:hypothetical protein